jgi:hypothetical protein
MWDDVVLSMHKASDNLLAAGIFDHLCEHHLDKFSANARRTLEPRIAQSRTFYGERNR